MLVSNLKEEEYNVELITFSASQLLELALPEVKWLEELAALMNLNSKKWRRIIAKA